MKKLEFVLKHNNEELDVWKANFNELKSNYLNLDLKNGELKKSYKKFKNEKNSLVIEKNKMSISFQKNVKLHTDLNQKIKKIKCLENKLKIIKRKNLFLKNEKT